LCGATGWKYFSQKDEIFAASNAIAKLRFKYLELKDNSQFLARPNEPRDAFCASSPVFAAVQ